MSSIPKPEESAVAKLDKLLDERSVKHYYPDKEKNFGGGYIEWRNSDGIGFRASNACFGVDEDEFARKLIVHMVKVTPEQAIAATLGGGTLTAEQVENAVYRHCKFYEGGDVDAQAIADELNAALGRGTCKHTKQFFGYVQRECDGESYMWQNRKLPKRCPNCGCEVVS